MLGYFDYTYIYTSIRACFHGYIFTDSIHEYIYTDGIGQKQMKGTYIYVYIYAHMYTCMYS